MIVETDWPQMLYVVEDDHKVLILLPLPPKSLVYRHITTRDRQSYSVALDCLRLTMLLTSLAALIFLGIFLLLPPMC